MNEPIISVPASGKQRIEMSLDPYENNGPKEHRNARFAAQVAIWILVIPFVGLLAILALILVVLLIDSFKGKSRVQ